MLAGQQYSHSWEKLAWVLLRQGHLTEIPNAFDGMQHANEAEMLSQDLVLVSRHLEDMKNGLGLAFEMNCYLHVWTEVRQLAVIEEFKLNREDLLERITSLEDEIAQREQLNRAQLEQQEREQIEAKNKYETTTRIWTLRLPFLFSILGSDIDFENFTYSVGRL